MLYVKSYYHVYLYAIQIYFIEFPLIYFLYLNCHSMVYRTELKTVIAINVFVSKENVTMDVLF